MGKGKAKGFRPSKDDNSMLFGSAAHLTGNSIASPVQLRQEGTPMPKDHLNYGDDGKGKGYGKAPKGATGEAAATGANQVEVRPKAAGPESEVKPEPTKPVEPTKPKPVFFEPSRPVGVSSGSTGMSEIERRRAAMSEIERRRNQMLQREVASQQAEGGDDDPEARRQAMEARRQAEAGGACKGEVKNEVQQDGSGLAAVKEEEMQPEEGWAQEGQGEQEEYEEEDEVSRAAARRRRMDEEEGQQQEDVKKPRTDAGGDAGAMKQGLQGWAEQVNALAADGSSAELGQACRDYVRKRILRAHMEGNLHSVDWAEEPVPLPEELLLAMEGEG